MSVFIPWCPFLNMPPQELMGTGTLSNVPFGEPRVVFAEIWEAGFRRRLWGVISFLNVSRNDPTAFRVGRGFIPGKRS